MATSMDAPKYGAITSPASLDEKESQVSHNGACVENPQIIILVALLCAASISEGYDLGVVNGAIVQIQEHFNFDPSRVGLIVAITPAFSIVGALLHGALADQFGRRVGLVSAVAFLF